MTEGKTCTKCRKFRTLDRFYKDKRNSDGRASHCKECFKVYNDARYLKYSSKILARNAIYRDSHKEEKKALTKKYLKQYPDRRRKTCAQYCKNNTTKIRAYNKIYCEQHREERAAYEAMWRRANPEKHCATEARRRSRKFNAAGDATVEQIQNRWEMFGNKCYICGVTATATDHVIPLAKGGSNWPANLRPICNRCNSMKGAKWPYNISGEHTTQRGTK